MLKKWAASLVDPESGEPLTLSVKEAQGEDVIEGELVAAQANRKYAIIRGVPRFVAEELLEEPSETDSDAVQTAKCYGDFWRSDANRSLGHTDAEVKSYEPRLLAMLGVQNRAELKDLFKDGMNSLNAGCGVAWSEYLFNVNENANRFAADLSLSVDVAYEQTREMPNVSIAQADLFKLPYKKSFFDIIFSAGVLHSTGDARKAFANLCSHLKPGGLIGIYIYKVKPLLRELADSEIRKTTTEMSFDESKEFAEQMAKLGRSLQKFTDSLVIEDDIPLLGMKRGEYNLQKFIYDHFLKCKYDDRLGYDLSILSNIDWYLPKYATHHTREEVTSWFDANQVKDVQFIDLEGWEHSGFFVSGRKLV